MCVTITFTKGCEQLAASEIEETKKLVMIHVERVIGAICQNTLFCPDVHLQSFSFQPKLALIIALIFFAGIL